MNPLQRLYRALALAVALLAPATTVNASTSLYTFDGVFTGFRSYNPSITLEDVGAILGVTRISYTFEVDFDRNVSTSTNVAGTWNYFYSDLRGSSFVSHALNGVPPEEHQSFDALFNFQPNLGELVGGNFVRIEAWSSSTAAWRVEDWRVGQDFPFSDGTVPGAGGLAVYLDGNVTLTSISTVPEPVSTALILAVATFIVCAIGRQYKRGAAQSGKS